MNKLLQSFKDRRFKYGSYSTITALIIIAVLIAVNLVIGRLDVKFDLTHNDMYSISETSEEIIKNLDAPVTIYALFKTGSEEATFTEVLDQYEKLSDNIKVEYKDPYIYPQFTEKYKTRDSDIDVNSLIVESQGRFKVVPASSLFETDYDYTTGSVSATAFNMESVLTSAIQYVTMEKLPIIYNVTGHNETALPSAVSQQFNVANYEVRELDVFNLEKIPDDCSILMITTPSSDYSEKEARIIKDYLSEDGRAMVFLNYSIEGLPNLESVLNGYGVALEGAVVIDANPANCYGNQPVYLLPDMQEHDILKGISDKSYRILLPFGQALNNTDLKKNSLTIEPLLLTSKDSYGKDSPESQSVNKEEGDKEGPFAMAYAVTDSIYTDTNHTTKLVIVGSSDFMVDEINSAVRGANGSFVLNCANWLDDRADSVYISPKSLSADTIMVDSASFLRIALFSCVILPGILFASGIVVWFRRRNK